MTRKQKKIAKCLLETISSSTNISQQGEAIKNYTIFVSECREQERFWRENFEIKVPRGIRFSTGLVTSLEKAGFKVIDNIPLGTSVNNFQSHDYKQP